MVLAELRLENFRNIAAATLEPAPGVNLIVGANGAGKTSLLEAIYLLSHGRSFRSGRNEVLRRIGSAQTSVFGVRRAGGASARLGLLLDGARWQARIDGERPPALAALLRRCAVVAFEPGSHELLSGVSDERRAMIDWGVFHVEQDFAAVAARYRRALRQRNLALRADCGDSELDAWDSELATAAAPLASARDRYMRRFGPVLERLLASYVPELGPAQLRFERGWSADRDLEQALVDTRDRDRMRRHTSRGPHRADWHLAFASAPRREHLSRGQEKLCALAAMLVQGRLYRDDAHEWPIVVLDDLASELDEAHQRVALESVGDAEQVFITATVRPEVLATASIARTFHVEQGQVRSLL